MTNGRRWVALDADMFGKPFTIDLHDRFGPAGIAVWVAFLCACKRSHIPGRIRVMNEYQAARELGIAGWELVDSKGEPWTLDDFWAFTGRKKQTRRTSVGRARDKRRTSDGRATDVIATHWERWQKERATSEEAERKRRSRSKNKWDTSRTNPGHNLGHTPDANRTNVRPDNDIYIYTPPTPPEGGDDALRAEKPNPQNLRAGLDAVRATMPPPPPPKPKPLP